MLPCLWQYIFLVNPIDSKRVLLASVSGEFSQPTEENYSMWISLDRFNIFYHFPSQGQPPLCMTMDILFFFFSSFPLSLSPLLSPRGGITCDAERPTQKTKAFICATAIPSRLGCLTECNSTEMTHSHLSECLSISFCPLIQLLLSHTHTHSCTHTHTHTHADAS